jgi:hypothetical protein
MLLHRFLYNFLRKSERVYLALSIRSQLLSKVLKVLFCNSVENKVHLNFLFFNFAKLHFLRKKFIILGSIYNFVSHNLAFKTYIFTENYLYIFFLLTPKFYISGFLFSLFLIVTWFNT